MSIKMQLQKGVGSSCGRHHPAALAGGRHGAVARTRLLRQQRWKCSPMRPAVLLTEVQTPSLLLGNKEQNSVATAPAETQPEAFHWLRHWWPVSPVSYLDTKRPTKHTLLGRDYVVWQQHGQWQVFQDRCPHRLAPLSQGRIINNSLQCSYHGWAFEGSGKCTSIPQVPSDQQQSACNNKRSCATAYPTMVEQGILYAWLDASPEGIELSRSKGVALAVGEYKPIMYEFPTDYVGCLEQQMDPTHAQFLHAGSGFSSMDATPMELHQAPEVDVNKGFEVKHGGYNSHQKGMQATRYFFPPATNVGVYNMASGMGLTYHTMAVPVSPGVCRFFINIGFLGPGSDRTVIRDSVQHRMAKEAQAAHGVTAADDAQQSIPVSKAVPPAQPAKKQQPGFKQRLQAMQLEFRRKLPHWVTLDHTFADQDVVMMAAQERLATQNKLSSKNYHLPAGNADIGIVAMHRWLAKAGYPRALFPDAKHPAQAEPLGNLPLERILDRKTRHVNHCIVCQKGERLVTKACYVATTAAAMFGAFALALATAALVKSGSLMAGGVPLLISSMLTPVLAWISMRLWEFREERFVSGVNAWYRGGGLSLIPHT